MKRNALALILVLALLFSAVAGAQLSLLAKANFSLPPTDPSITIVSPTNSTYDVSTLSLEATFNSFKGILLGSEYVLNGPIIFTYTLDERAPERISITNSALDGYVFYYEGSANLTNLAEGLHSLKVYVAFDYRINYAEASPIHTESEATVNFRIDSVPPGVVLLSLENKTYYTVDVPLNFIVSEPDSQVTYCLDGQENVTAVGNTTLTNLPSGEHNVTVYAIDTAGNTGTSETIHFKIEPFPTTLIIASVASACVVVVGLVVYFKKRRHHAEMAGLK